MLCRSIPNPILDITVIEKPPFEVTETGWGEFEIQTKIFFVAEANEKILTVHHLLKLHPWTVKDNLIIPMPEGGRGADGGPSLDVVPVHSWQYDEVVFNDPTEALYNIMIQTPPTPLYVLAYSILIPPAKGICADRKLQGPPIKWNLLPSLRIMAVLLASCPWRRRPMKAKG